LEFIVRIAISKYLEAKRALSPSDAVKMFIRKDILPAVPEIREKWDGFRQNELWTLEVNEMFEVNKGMIVQVMEKFFQPRAKFLDMKDAVAIFSQYTDLLTETEAKCIYGMSKMTNPNEAPDIKKHKQITNVVELIEMIGRAADAKYRTGPEKDKPLAYKIGLALDKVFSIIGCSHIVPKQKEIADES